MSYKKTRFCPRNHDTALCGRNTAYRCRKCSVIDSTKWFNKMSKTEKSNYHRKANLKKMYGLTIEQYNWFFQNQKGYCLGCNRHQSILNRKLNVDHNHITTKVRGLLCIGCNRALGFVEENIQTLLNLANYLKENN
jgi:hypothetical protein